jgi:hypothetical protein
MTPKQLERLHTKIKSIRATLAAEKRKFGAYDDSRGLRYLPPSLYIKMQDYKGALTYLRWFQQNFPDDSGYPDFLFEWTFILFKVGKLKDAERKALQTFCANSYLFDKFMGRPIIPIDKYEGSNLAIPAFADYLTYNHTQPDCLDFAQWLIALEQTPAFQEKCAQFIEWSKQLKVEHDLEKRSQLVEQIWALKDNP